MSGDWAVWMQLAGLLVVAVGVALWSVPAGLVTLGVGLVVAGTALELGDNDDDAVAELPAGEEPDAG
jgi:hypothetical protein